MDVVIELNAATIRSLENVTRIIQRMAPEDASKYKLEDSLGGTSGVLHQRALRR